MDIVLSGGEKGPTKSQPDKVVLAGQPDNVILAGQPDNVILAGNLELLLVAQSGATGAAKLRVRTFRGRPRAWLVKGLVNSELK